jgi:hypothetical protein
MQLQHWEKHCLRQQYHNLGCSLLLAAAAGQQGWQLQQCLQPRAGGLGQGG